MFYIWINLKKKILESLKHRQEVLLVLLGVIVVTIGKISISTWGYHVDLITIAPWGRWIFENGAKGFYQTTGWVYSAPTQLPQTNLLYAGTYLIYYQLLEFFRYASSYIIPHLAPGHMLWWFDFVIWFDSAKYPLTDIPLGYLLVMKLPAIIADALIACLIYFFAKTIKQKRSWIYPGLYLLSPFSFYLSTWWGQYDQLGFLFLLLSFWFIWKKNFLLSLLIFFWCVGIKPTSLIFLPFYLWLFFYRKPSLKIISLGSGLLTLLFIATTLPFVDKDFYSFLKEDLIRAVFFKAEYRISTNAFNYWHIFIGNMAMNQDTPLLSLPTKYWAYLFFGIINLLAILLIRKKENFEGLWKALYIIGAGGWLFWMNMLERYYFAGIGFLLLLCVYKPELIKYWCLASLVFFLNLFHGWWFPESLGILKQVLIWNDGLVTRFLSLVNFIIFFRVIYSELLSNINSLQAFGFLAKRYKVINGKNK